MIVKILSSQVPQFWEAIKFAATQADEVNVENTQLYLNELLHALLNDKAQCFTVLDDNRVLVGVLITRIEIDKITGERFLYLQIGYTWKSLEDKIWKETYEIFRSFATNLQCKYILFSSRNPAIWNRMEKLGFKEKIRTHSLNLD